MTTTQEVLKKYRALTVRRLALALSLALVLSTCRSGQADANKANTPAGEGPVGIWRGESKCLVRPSACNDENAVYRISAKGQNQDRINVAAGKIVNGREIMFGSGECTYDAKTNFIECPLPNGHSIHLELNGSILKGKMTLHDGTLWRTISLHRAEK